MAAAFDTLTAARRMEEAGMKCEQAEAVAEAVRSAAESGRGELATKADLAELKVDLVDRMQSGERRMYAAVFGVGGLLFAALKLFP
ncbi:MAG: hypothetical protein OXI22_03185 [Defluviicoccus sp.]|nr:hypothetical protein [Defluviicoccus sp.]MDE0382863.1 hypothetical protein [Defluviicoccus sp.]